ncbi:hypothetical protein ACMGDH_11070 [Sphingomonas sp. DT-207]|uniref:hypothetical protein n=1 Tax=Sphingomonas sp. DT-207 TaxID=3396167 RepID=UPI003F1C4302
MHKRDEKTGAEPLLLRLLAAGTALGTVIFLFIGDGWRLSNVFLFPDLCVSAALFMSVFLPRNRLYPALLSGFAMGIGVFATATASQLVEGRLGIGAGIALATSTLGAGILLHRALPVRAGQPL